MYIKGSALCHMDSVTTVSADVSAECHAEQRCEWVGESGTGGGPPELIKVLGKFPPHLHMSHAWVRGRRESMRKAWQLQKVALQWKGQGESWGRCFRGLSRWSGLRATRQVVRVYDFGPRQWPFFLKISFQGCFRQETGTNPILLLLFLLWASKSLERIVADL